ncbi:polysaccharide deacetylase family protein [Arthrobacter sp. MDT1-65]
MTATLFLVVLLLGASISGSVPAHSSVGAEPSVGAPRTMVSLTFDDGHDDQVDAARVLADYGLRGTFFVSSGLIADEPGPTDPAPTKMTLAQLQDLQAAGHEIGGHTVTHADLAEMDAEEAQRQVCNDRTKLVELGLDVTNFAYPYGTASRDLEQIVAGCGYNSARGLGDIRSPELPRVTFTCEECPVAETTPPADPFRTKAPNQVENTWTLADLQKTVTDAETTGGWLQLTFHHIDATGTSLSVPPSVFDAFAGWLAARAPLGTVVRTVDEVIGGPQQATVEYPPAPRAGNLLRNPGLETPSHDSALPACWQGVGWGENRPSFTVVEDAHSGDAGSRLDLADYVGGDAKLLPTLDLGTCSPPVESGRAYDLGAWYKSTGETQFEIYVRDSDGSWTHWTSSPPFPPTDEWTHATFTTPHVPRDVDGLSFGLNLREAGTLVTDDYSQEVDITWDEFLTRSVAATWAQVRRAFTAPFDNPASLSILASPW